MALSTHFYSAFRVQFYITGNGVLRRRYIVWYANLVNLPYKRVIVNVPLSIAAKGNYIKDEGLAGFAMWEAGGDSNDILLDAINSAIGIGC